VYYRSKFALGLHGSEPTFVCRTFDHKLLLLSAIPRDHAVVFAGDQRDHQHQTELRPNQQLEPLLASNAKGIAVLVGMN
jgi:hypothetical protein